MSTETTTTPAKTRTITLTDRPPVTIREDQWPIIATDCGAGDADDSDGRGNQPNREWERTIKVRQHEDGRALVYGIYHYATRYQGESDVRARRGLLLGPASTARDIVAAIRQIGDDLDAVDGNCEAWSMAVQACIADLPAEAL